MGDKLLAAEAAMDRPLGGAVVLGAIGLAMGGAPEFLFLTAAAAVVTVGLVKGAMAMGSAKEHSSEYWAEAGSAARKDTLKRVAFGVGAVGVAALCTGYLAVAAPAIVMGLSAASLAGPTAVGIAAVVASGAAWVGSIAGAGTAVAVAVKLALNSEGKSSGVKAKLSSRRAARAEPTAAPGAQPSSPSGPRP